MAINRQDRVVAALLATIGVLAALLTSTAFAFPEGAPWGAANPDSEENCSSCHFGYDATREADVLSIQGLPAKIEPGETYELQLSFDDDEAVIAGFQLLATAGEFQARESTIEFLGAVIRSTQPASADAGFNWTLTWTAPDAPETHVTIYMAVVGGNDDLSPFGDRAFFRTFEIGL